MSITKNVLPNWYYLMEKIEKDSDDFWHRKLTLKVKFWHFSTPLHYTNSQNSIISFGYVYFYAKIFKTLYPPLTNLTTCITTTPVWQTFDILNFFQPVITWQQTIRNFKAVMSLVEKSVKVSKCCLTSIPLY